MNFILIDKMSYSTNKSGNMEIRFVTIDKFLNYIKLITFVNIKRYQTVVFSDQIFIVGKGILCTQHIKKLTRPSFLAHYIPVFMEKTCSNLLQTASLQRYISHCKLYILKRYSGIL